MILPNIRAAALGGAFLTLAIVMGEFTIANLAAFHTFPIYIEYVNETQAYPAAALTLMSFGITWLRDAGAALSSAASAAAGRLQIAGGRLMATSSSEDLHRNFGPVEGAERDQHLAGRRASSSRCSARRGCGKTTALRLVAGFDRPDAGRILVDGKDMTASRPTSATWAWSSRPTASSRT